MGNLPTRQIHLDFHAGPTIPDVGAEFDAKGFAATMKAAHVNSVTVFAKCHHGHLYYQTSRPERHPSLPKNLNLLGEQIESLHRAGIAAPIYISVQCDEFAANSHPDWVARDPAGEPVRRPPGTATAGWQILDMSSPYQEFLAEQTREILRLFRPVDGIFFDMCWDQPSASAWAIAGMRKAGLDPQCESDHAVYARQAARVYRRRFFRMVKSSSGTASVYFNGRALDELAGEIAHFSHVEIESLPTGGWGYGYFPRHVRHVRTLGRPYLGQTARFHKSWADFGGLKPYAALEYETSLAIAHGASCSVGDQMHPRGKLDAAAYDLIGKAYARIEQREPWLDGAKPLAQIGVLQTPSDSGRIEDGATQMLIQLKHQFDIVSHDADFSRYELLILPDATRLSRPAIKRLAEFLRGGGAMLASGVSALDEDARHVLLPQLGIRAGGFSPFTASYVRFGKPIAAGIPDMDHVIYDRGVRAVPIGSAMKLAGVVEPYFERSREKFCSHRQTPPAKLSRYAAVVQHRRVGYIALPVFGSYARHGNLACRWLVGKLLDRLLPEPMLRMAAPATAEAAVTRQGRRTIVHLLHYCPQRRTPALDIVEDIVPLKDVEISLRMLRPPRRVYLAPQGRGLDFGHFRGRTRAIVPEINGHAMIVFE